jgi:hypothetical protein
MPYHVFKVTPVSQSEDEIRLHLACPDYEPFSVEGTFENRSEVTVVKVKRAVTDNGLSILSVSSQEVLFFNRETGIASYDADLVCSRSHRAQIGLA